MHYQSYLPARMAIATAAVGLVLVIFACMTPVAQADVPSEYRPQVFAQAERALEQGKPDRALALLHSQRAMLKHHRFVAEREYLACAAYYMKGQLAEAEQACTLAAQWGDNSAMWANLSNRGAMRLMPGELPTVVQQ